MHVLMALWDGGGTVPVEVGTARRLVDAGHRVVGFSQATSDLEEIFLKVTGQPSEEAAA